MQFYTLVTYFCIFHLTIEIDEFYFKDLRREFLERKEEKRKQDIRLKLLDRISNSTSIIFEGISHILENKNDIEEAFKHMLIMREATYVYKRDFVWRTWRDVKLGGNRKIVYYKCSNVVKKNCTQCDGGFWIIEEKPPRCPYEIFSTNSSNDICVFQYNSTLSDCSLRISRRDLKIACNNYIETSWRIKKKWKIKGKNTAILCQGRDFCDISTLYMILPDTIVFRIINSTNNIFYSKIMKNGNKNFICANDCGKLDPITKNVINNDEPLSLNLLNNKKKREEVIEKSSKISQLLPNGLHYHFKNGERSSEERNSRYFNNLLKLSKNMSSCSKIRDKYIQDENLSDYWYN